MYVWVLLTKFPNRFSCKLLLKGKKDKGLWSKIIKIGVTDGLDLEKPRFNTVLTADSGS